MRKALWLFLTVVGSGCGTTAVDGAQDGRLDALEQKDVELEATNGELEAKNTDLLEQLTAAVDALNATNARLEALEAHERLVAGEVIDDGLGGAGVSGDLQGLIEQLATSRLDDWERADLSCADCVTDAELTLTLADYATNTDIAPLATRVEVEAGDAAERQWVIDQHYLTSADLSGYATVAWMEEQGFATVFYVDTQDALLLQSQGAGDAAERQWVVDQHFATETWVDGLGYVTHAELDPYATDADLAALAGRVSTIEGDYLRAADLLPYATDADLADLAGRVSIIEGDYLQASDLLPYATRDWVAANYPEQAELDAAESTLDDHEDRIAALEAAVGGVAGLVPLADYLSVDAGGDVVITRANLRVVSGAGATEAPTNGKGNVIIGYDEDDGDNKSGSHNLIVGLHHTYVSSGGIVGGQANQLLGPSAFAVGYGNVAQGVFASVAGGRNGYAEGPSSTICGGDQNHAGYYATVVGGAFGFAGAQYSTVVGGYSNEAVGSHSLVAGGWDNTSSGAATVVSGGYGNTASSVEGTGYASVFGGHVNEAHGYLAAVLGGSGGAALADYSVVVGGVGAGGADCVQGPFGVSIGGSDVCPSGDASVALGGVGTLAGRADGVTVGGTGGGHDLPTTFAAASALGLCRLAGAVDRHAVDALPVPPGQTGDAVCAGFGGGGSACGEVHLMFASGDRFEDNWSSCSTPAIAPPPETAMIGTWACCLR